LFLLPTGDFFTFSGNFNPRPHLVEKGDYAAEILVSNSIFCFSIQKTPQFAHAMGRLPRMRVMLHEHLAANFHVGLRDFGLWKNITDRKRLCKVPGDVTYPSSAKAAFSNGILTGDL
jgi:hypothetical protein